MLLLALLALPQQTQADDYTRYELLAPASAQFRITYDVTATAPGARYYFNTIRKGSKASDESVVDPATGGPLRFEEVDGATARAEGHPGAALDTRYIKVWLPRPVPANGEVRIRIIKTYRDPASYLARGDTLVFRRSLSIRRNAVVLPAGYEVLSSNVPSQVLSEPDGRIVISFLNAGSDAASLELWALPVTRAGATGRTRVTERAAQTREIVYFLQPPETHAFDLYHDYTETRPGVGRYLNVVRAGSRVSNPSAILLDTGEPLRVRTLRGEAITREGIDIGEPVKPESEVVVIDFPPVQPGHSTRLRIFETYTDPVRYRLDGDELVWDRGFGRPFNAVVLPAGWTLAQSSIPGTISRTADGRVRLDFVNPRNDEIQVLLVARRRQ
ncbi:MAG TPA: hypothetical protein VF862_04080 [Gemmatimonadales bacterium]